MPTGKQFLAVGGRRAASPAGFFVLLMSCGIHPSERVPVASASTQTLFFSFVLHNVRRTKSSFDTYIKCVFRACHWSRRCNSKEL